VRTKLDIYVFISLGLSTHVHNYTVSLSSQYITDKPHISV